MESEKPEYKNNAMGGLRVGEEVLEAIRSGKAKMRPRWRFTAQAILIIVIALLVVLLLVYIASSIMFDLEKTGAWSAPLFGFAGWYVFAQAVPWLLIFLSALAILLVTFLVRHYSFAYHWPVLYLLVAIILLAIGGSVLVSRTPLYGQLFDGVPEVDRLYRGEVLTITGGGDSFLLEDARGHTSTVLVTSGTFFPNGRGLRPGDLVVIFGSRDSSVTITAAGVDRL